MADNKNPLDFGVSVQNKGSSPTNLGVSVKNRGSNPTDFGVSIQNKGGNPTDFGVSIQNKGSNPTDFGVSIQNKGSNPTDFGVSIQNKGGNVMDFNYRGGNPFSFFGSQQKKNNVQADAPLTKFSYTGVVEKKIYGGTDYVNATVSTNDYTPTGVTTSESVQDLFFEV